MDLQQLAKLSDTEIATWVRSNSNSFTLISDAELEDVISQRDHWEERATELASDVGTLLNIDVGEHSSANCPVQNALDAVFHANAKKEKAAALKQRIKGVLDNQKLN